MKLRVVLRWIYASLAGWVLGLALSPVAQAGFTIVIDPSQEVTQTQKTRLAECILQNPTVPLKPDFLNQFAVDVETDSLQAADSSLDVQKMGQFLATSRFPHQRQDILRWLDILEYIEIHKNLWMTQANNLSPEEDALEIQLPRNLHRTWSELFPSLAIGQPDPAMVYVKRDGTIYIDYQSHVVGTGSYKTARSGVEISPTQGRAIDTLKFKTFLSWDRREKPEDNEREKKRELDIFADIQDRQMNLTLEAVPGDMEGMIDLDVIRFQHHVGASRTLGMRAVQDYFQTDLWDKPLISFSDPGNIIEEILNGLSSFHALGLVHGDLKEPNIFLNLDGTHVVLADYGLTYDPTKKFWFHSTTGYESPEMAGPERYIGTQDISKIKDSETRIRLGQARDVFSFGMIALRSFPPFYTYKNKEGKDIAYEGLHTKCQHLFTKYVHSIDWGPYGKCISDNAPAFYREARLYATRTCGVLERHPENDCLAWLAADSLNPFPLQRPTSEDLLERIQKINFRKTTASP